jgi:hypothetical protein
MCLSTLIFTLRKFNYSKNTRPNANSWKLNENEEKHKKYNGIGGEIETEKAEYFTIASLILKHEGPSMLKGFRLLLAWSRCLRLGWLEILFLQ